jgi:hypothetical protein
VWACTLWQTREFALKSCGCSDCFTFVAARCWQALCPSQPQASGLSGVLAPLSASATRSSESRAGSPSSSSSSSAPSANDLAPSRRSYSSPGKGRGGGGGQGRSRRAASYVFDYAPAALKTHEQSRPPVLTSAQRRALLICFN